MRLLGLVLLAVLPCLAQSDVVLIHGARVIDGTGAPARAVNVRLRGGRIDAVGTDIAAPAGARIVEAAGKTLIPGLSICTRICPPRPSPESPATGARI